MRFITIKTTATITNSAVPKSFWSLLRISRC